MGQEFYQMHFVRFTLNYESIQNRQIMEQENYGKGFNEPNSTT